MVLIWAHSLLQTADSYYSYCNLFTIQRLLLILTEKKYFFRNSKKISLWYVYGSFNYPPHWRGSAHGIIVLFQMLLLEEQAREVVRQERRAKEDEMRKRREYNMEQRTHLQNIKHSQGMTKAWTFSYNVQWPMNTYTQ